MKEVDFRPNWYCAARKRRRDAIIRAALLGVLALELSLGLLTVSSRKAEAKQQLANLRSALENQTTVFQDLDALSIDLDELQKKRAMLSDVAGGASVHSILAELSQIMTESLTLTSIKYKQRRKVGVHPMQDKRPDTPGAAEIEVANELGINGLAVSDRDVGMLMSRLASSVLFENVTLVYSRPVIRADTPAREFKLKCVVPQFE